MFLCCTPFSKSILFPYFPIVYPKSSMSLFFNQVGASFIRGERSRQMLYAYSNLFWIWMKVSLDCYGFHSCSESVFLLFLIFSIRIERFSYQAILTLIKHHLRNDLSASQYHLLVKMFIFIFPLFFVFIFLNFLLNFLKSHILFQFH